MSSTAEVPANKLYVGNIEYHTTEDELRELFKDYEIEGIEIPSRVIKNKAGEVVQNRTKGYVFITFKDEDASQLDQIIEKFNDLEFKGRKIYLRHPQPRSELARERAANKENEAGNGGEVEKKTTKKNKPKKTTKAAANANAIPANKQTARREKEKIPFDQGVKSKDTLYLKNLAFTVKPQDIKEFVSSVDEEAQWVSVPLLKLPGFVLKKLQAQGKSLDRRNKGYAFVQLKLKDGETIDDKVAKFNGLKFEDRELLASVAIDVRNAKKLEEEEAKEEAEEVEKAE